MHITIVTVLSLPNREGAGGMGVALHQGPLGRINAGGVVSTGQAAISASTSPSGTALLSSAFVITSHYNGARQHKLHSRVCDLEMALMGCTEGGRCIYQWPRLNIFRPSYNVHWDTAFGGFLQDRVWPSRNERPHQRLGCVVRQRKVQRDASILVGHFRSLGPAVRSFI